MICSLRNNRNIIKIVLIFEEKTCMIRNILLTGVPGTMGTQVLKQLLAQGDRNNITVFALFSKANRKFFQQYKDKIRIVYGDITCKDDLIDACKNQDFVIHNAGIIPPLAHEDHELTYNVNVKGTQNLINTLEEHSPQAFFIFSSSVTVYGDRIKNPEIKLSDPLSLSIGDKYGESKISAEKMIRESTLNWTIFRLPAVMSINHKVSGIMFLVPLDTHMETTSPEDTARAQQKACDHKDELNKRIFNLGGGESCRIIYRELLTESFKIFGLGKLNFPEKAFAEKNFHCGYYVDGNVLEEILHFRNNTIDDYFESLRHQTSPITKAFTSLLKFPIKKYLLKHSEPLKAFKDKDVELMEKFFN